MFSQWIVRFQRTFSEIMIFLKHFCLNSSKNNFLWCDIVLHVYSLKKIKHNNELKVQIHQKEFLNEIDRQLAKMPCNASLI